MSNKFNFLDIKEFKKQAKDVDGLTTNVGIRKNFIASAVEEVKMEGTDDRILRFIISSSSVDRDNDTLDVNGWDVGNYLKNPVVLFGHDGRSPPVAKANNVFFENDFFKSDAQFMPKDMYEFSDMLYKMYLGGYMRATSVGFNPSEYKFSDDRDWGIDFKKQELLEYSLVPVPSNPDAIMEARKSGIETSPLMGWAEEMLDTKEYKGLLVPRSTIEKMYKDADGKSKVTIWVDSNGVTVESEDNTEKNLNETGETNDNNNENEGKTKDLDMKLDKKPISYASAHADGTPKAAEDVKWDGPSEIANADVADLKVMSSWVDEENQDTKGAYKLPHHKSDAEHTLIWKGVSAAMGALLGARGGVDIPDTERKGVYNHLVKHYKEFDKEPPEFKHVEAQTLKTAGDFLEFDLEKGQITAVKQSVDTEEKTGGSENGFIDGLISALSTKDEKAGNAEEGEDFTKLFSELGMSEIDLAKVISESVKSEIATLTGKLD